MAEKGKIKFYNWKKRFGFVTGDNGEDYFLHKSGIPKGVKVFTDDEIEFEVKDGPQGKNAYDVKVIKSANPEGNVEEPQTSENLVAEESSEDESIEE